jgi:cytochrome c oxidase subunit 1
MKRLRILLDLAVILSIGALSWGAYSSFIGITLNQPGTDGLYHDTDYVVGHFHLTSLLLLSVPIGLALHFTVLRRSSRAWIVRGSHLSLAVGLASLWVFTWPQSFAPEGPRTYIEYPAHVANLTRVTYIAIGTLTASAAALLSLTFAALLLRRRDKT